MGPLHGLPVTFKDQYHVSGAETTMGYVGWIGTFEGSTDKGDKKKVDSELVRELVALGAIPIALVSLLPSIIIRSLIPRQTLFRLWGYVFYISFLSIFPSPTSTLHR